MLSEESIRKRRRQDTISIQMTFFSWLIEGLTGAIQILYVYNWADNGRQYGIIFLVDLTFCSIIVPGCYLVKTESIKQKLYSQGWYKCIINSLPQQNVKVVPAHELIIKESCIDRRSPYRMNLQTHNSRIGPNLNNNSSPPESMIACDDNDENWLMRIDLFDNERLLPQDEMIAQSGNEAANDSWIYNIDIFEGV